MGHVESGVALLPVTREDSAHCAFAQDVAAWPQVRAVAHLPGSLPDGGVVHDTLVHAFVDTPPRLAWSDSAPWNLERQDLPLGGLIAFVLEPVASAEECQALIDAAEHLGFRAEAPGIHTPPGMRQNKTVHWLVDDALMRPLWQRIAPGLPPEVDGLHLMPGLSHRINMYRYDDQDVFNIHIDGDWPGYSLDASRTGMRPWPQGRSCLSMLLYLNRAEDGVQGGATRLWRRDGSSVDVIPRRGAALFFRHGQGSDSVRHQGMRVHGPMAKYVARINVMYA